MKATMSGAEWNRTDEYFLLETLATTYWHLWAVVCHPVSIHLDAVHVDYSVHRL